VIEDRVRYHLHAVAGSLHAPAEVEVVPEQPQPGVEAAEPVPHIPPDQHAGRTDREHRAVVVVLALVDLAGLDPGDTAARAVNGDTDLAQHAPVLPIKDLGADHHDRTVPARRPQQPLQRLRGGLAVIVQQPDPLNPLEVRVGPWGMPRGTVLERDRDRLAVAGAPVHPEYRVMPDQVGEHRAAAVPAPGVHPDDPLDLVGLRMQRLDEPGQQAGAVVRDDDRGDDMAGLRRGS